MLPPILRSLKDWTATLLVGTLVVSYWRGTWVLLDAWTCDQPPSASLAGGDSFCLLVPAAEDAPDGHRRASRTRSAWISYGTGLALLFLGVTALWSGAWLPRSRGRVTPSRTFARFLVVYVLGFSAVCLWRGVWYLADAHVLPHAPLASYWATSLGGSSAAFLLGAGASLLAPPAIVLTDGPGESPPPLGVTVASSYYSLTLPYDEDPPELSTATKLLDVIVSFLVLPILVVCFWRGTWLLLDHYLWGFTPDPSDVHRSMLWGAVLAAACFALTCEPVLARVDGALPDARTLGLLGRLRTYVLAWGTVSFWRVVWYAWDEFLGKTSEASAWASHAGGVVFLTWMGCVASINAPASTLGVDAVPHEECADEPLFAMVPIPYEILYFCAIGREPREREGATVEVGASAPPKDVEAVTAVGGETSEDSGQEEEETPVGEAARSNEAKKEAEEGRAAKSNEAKEEAKRSASVAFADRGETSEDCGQEEEEAPVGEAASSNEAKKEAEEGRAAKSNEAKEEAERSASVAFADEEGVAEPSAVPKRPEMRSLGRSLSMRESFRTAKYHEWQRPSQRQLSTGSLAQRPGNLKRERSSLFRSR